MKFESAFDPFYERHDAVVMQAKSLAMIAIVDHMRTHGISQVNMADSLGISQPRLSNLKRGMISKFSLDSMMRMCAKVGIEVEFRADGRSAKA